MTREEAEKLAEQVSRYSPEVSAEITRYYLRCFCGACRWRARQVQRYMRAPLRLMQETLAGKPTRKRVRR